MGFRFLVLFLFKVFVVGVSFYLVGLVSFSLLDVSMEVSCLFAFT